MTSPPAARPAPTLASTAVGLAMVRWLPLSIASLLATAGLARADIAPSSDPNCTLAEQCPDAGRLCPFEYADSQIGAECRTKALRSDHENRCKATTSTAGYQLFCPYGATASSPGPGAHARGCTVAVTGGTGLLALFGLLALRRRTPR
jgi:MYXO-CTERM domain-containing protein